MRQLSSSTFGPSVIGRADGEERHHEEVNARHGRGFDMTQKTIVCCHIAAGFAVVFASAISDTQAQPIVRVEDCGKTAVFECAASGQLMGGASHPYHPYHYGKRAHHIYLYPSYDQPTRDRERLWNDP